MAGGTAEGMAVSYTHLIVVVLRLAKVVDNIAQVEEERRGIRSSGSYIRDQCIRCV